MESALEAKIETYKNLRSEQASLEKLADTVRHCIRVAYHQLPEYPGMIYEIDMRYPEYAKALKQLSEISVRVNRARNAIIKHIDSEVKEKENVY